MIAAARRYGRVVSGGSQRVLDDYHGIVDPCWAGEIGTIKSLDIAIGGPSMPCYLPAEPTPPLSEAAVPVRSASAARCRP